MHDTPFDELDMAIVDAVRSAPRANWRHLAPIIGVDPATVSRRWWRMHATGAAWVTAHPAGGATPSCALVEIVCVPGRSTQVAEVLADDVEAATVNWPPAHGTCWSWRRHRTCRRCPRTSWGGSSTSRVSPTCAATS